MAEEKPTTIILQHMNPVSPLSSLMQDQVDKLNGLSGGSAQQVINAQQAALRGDYPLIYVTPEKWNTMQFLSQLESLHKQHKRICLFAIDEAHCVSEWGNDFRPDYRNLGSLLRDSGRFPDVPVITLTATATERVQDDIVTSLRLRNHLHIRRSFDRNNLHIRITKKQGSLVGTFRPLLESIRKDVGANAIPSTIIYAPTRTQVEEIANFFRSNVTSSLTAIPIGKYHAGMSPLERQQQHTDFLTGRTPIMVATVAFGMGIDKPDIRRIVHFGPPKTVEEYYQQIGLAGRDGLTSECILAFNESDFDRYKSDYYLGRLSATARRATEDSMRRFRAICLDSQTCRRKALLEYFDEKPPHVFGDWCGTCDVCVSRQTYGESDAQRDLGPLGARMILYATGALQEQGLTNILKVIAGSTVEPYRYARGVGTPQQVQAKLAEMRQALGEKRYPANYFRDLFPPLVTKGLISESSKSATISGFNKSWTVFSLAQEGRRVLMDPTLPILLPVPEFVRQAEKQEEERRQRVLADLTNKGLKKEKIPQSELENGDGDVIRAYSKWYSYVEGARRADRLDRIHKLESLLAAIEKWRSDAAVKYRMAPASVMPEHLVASIAYTTASLTPGLKLDKESIVASGVRTRDVDGLVAVLAAWVEDAQPSNTSSSIKSAKAGQMVLSFLNADPNENRVTAWRHAIYKPNKKTGKAVWEVSYERFISGESPQTIAMSQGPGKKPIQVRTVVLHLLDAIVYGRNVDLSRLSPFLRPPTKKEWLLLRSAELSTGMDVCGDPDKCGRNGEGFTMTEFLRPILGDQIVYRSYAERSDAEKDFITTWYDLVKWYMALRRVDYEPTFSE